MFGGQTFGGNQKDKPLPPEPPPQAETTTLQSPIEALRRTLSGAQ